MTYTLTDVEDRRLSLEFARVALRAEGLRVTLEARANRPCFGGHTKYLKETKICDLMKKQELAKTNLEINIQS